MVRNVTLEKCQRTRVGIITTSLVARVRSNQRSAFVEGLFDGGFGLMPLHKEMQERGISGWLVWSPAPPPLPSPLGNVFYMTTVSRTANQTDGGHFQSMRLHMTKFCHGSSQPRAFTTYKDDFSGLHVVLVHAAHDEEIIHNKIRDHHDEERTMRLCSILIFYERCV